MAMRRGPIRGRRRLLVGAASALFAVGAAGTLLAGPAGTAAMRPQLTSNSWSATDPALPGGSAGGLTYPGSGPGR